MVTLEIFVTAALFSMTFRLLAPGRASFSLTLQVLAYSVAPHVLCVVPLLGGLAETEMPYTSPKGRPTAILLSMRELHRKFHREG